jgi:aldose 1-epimerase
MAVDIFTLKNSKGAEAKITNYGGRIVSLKVPGRDGKFEDVVLGYENLDGYLNDKSAFGGIIGRFANRIAGGRFSLGGREFLLAKNNGENHLHGGIKGFDAKVWKAKSFVKNDGAKLELNYKSPDGEENYPGNLTLKVVYTLTETDELKIEYSASTDRDTVINLTNHSYFNLASAGEGTILEHVLQINADKFTPTDSSAIPTGEIQTVENTPFDFLKPFVVGERINAENEQIKFGNGYDHNFVLNKKPNELTLAATAFEPNSGRVLEVLTTEPGIQFYTGNYLDNVKGKNGKIYDRREGFCLETQHFPDSPNKPNFPTTVLKKGEKFASITVYKFSVR